MDEEQIEQFLKSIPGARRAAKGVILETEDGFFHATGVLTLDPELRQDEAQFVGFCAKNEILRMRNLRNAHDYLLRFRAMAIADAPRMQRVFTSRREAFERNGRVWSLSAYYDTQNEAPKAYVANLPKRSRHLVKGIPSGFAPVREVNALCLKSILGEIVVVSEALRYFYYFMMVYLHGAHYGMSSDDGLRAGLIGIRTIIGSESLDFDIDFRGALPQPTEGIIQRQVNRMIQFTFGHEYSHFLLNHLSDPRSVSDADDQTLKTYSHTHEYEADLQAIKSVSDGRHRAEVSMAAYNVFLCLHLIELLSDDHPEIPTFSVSNTHPKPLERLRSVREGLGDRNQPERGELGQAIKAVRDKKQFLSDAIKTIDQPDLLSQYGSVHMLGLGGKPGVDRIDF
jgi:hypothetical protein